MAKRKLSDDDFDLGLEMDTFDPSAAAAKLPVDVRGGKTPLRDYMDLPVEIIDPFALKAGSDFSRPSGALYERFVDTVREVGVIEAITVRPKNDGRYELLSGESRWSAAKDVGLRVVPSHIIEADDATARKIYSWTNLVRRDLSVRDRIYGWWQYYTAVKEAGDLRALRDGTLSDGMNKYVSTSEKISFRQIMRFVRMHELIPGWVDLLEPDPETGRPPVILRVGEQIAGLPANRQEQLLPYAKKITEDMAKQFLSLDKGELFTADHTPVKWSEETIQKVLNGSVSDPDPLFRATSRSTDIPIIDRLRPKIMNAAKAYLHPEDYDRAPEVIQEALELYYERKRRD